MKPLTNDEYVKKVMEICHIAKTEFPTVYYDRDGDCIEALMKPDAYYAERIDDLVTVYCSEVNGDIIGCLIKGVKKVLEKDPRTQIILQAGRMRLADFFLVGFLTQKKADLRAYQRLRECVANIETELQCC